MFNKKNDSEKIHVVATRDSINAEIEKLSEYTAKVDNVATSTVYSTKRVSAVSKALYRKCQVQLDYALNETFATDTVENLKFRLREIKIAKTYFTDAQMSQCCENRKHKTAAQQKKDIEKRDKKESAMSTAEIKAEQSRFAKLAESREKVTT